MLDWILNGGSYKGNYNFHIEVSPKVTESNSNITITCYSNKNKGAVIPVAINWFKLKNGLTTHLSSVRGNTYMCDPSDVGAIIRAEVRSLDQQSNGTAIVDVGPVRIDVVTKKNIENILSSGIGNFTVFLTGKSRDRQGSLRIQDNVMRIKDIVTDNCYKFEYTVSDPLIELHPRDNTRIILRFSEAYEDDLNKFLRATFGDDIPMFQIKKSLAESSRYGTCNKIELRFSSRTTKDMFIYSYRAFVARKEIQISALIKKLQHIDMKNEDNFNFLLEIQSLKTEVVRLMEINKEQARQKDTYHREIKRLQEQMERIIFTYTKIVEDKCKNQQEFNQSYSVLTNKRDQLLNKKQKHLQNQNKELSQKIALLNSQIEQLRNGRGSQLLQPPMQNNLRTSHVVQMNFTKKSMPAADLESKVHELSRINNVLADENARLKQTSHMQSRLVVKEKTFDNILDSLNESIVRDLNHDKLQQMIGQLQRDNANYSRQLESSNRKNEQLAQALRQAESKVAMNSMPNSQAQSRVIRVGHPGSANTVQTVYADTIEINRLVNQLNQSKRLNQKLTQDVVRFQNIHNADTSNCLAQQMEITRLKEEMASLSMNQSRAHYSTVVESSQIQRLRKERDQLASVKEAMEKKCDGLLIENSQLKKKISALEFDLEFAKANAKRVLDTGSSTIELETIKAENSSLKRQLHDKEETIQMLQGNVQRLKEDEFNGSRSSEVSRLRKKTQQLIQENRLLKRGQDVLNRSRDLSMEMDSYYQQENNMIKQQITMLTEQNERLIKMVEKYSKQAKETTKLRAEIIQLRSQNLSLKRQLQNRSTTNLQITVVKQDQQLIE